MSKQVIISIGREFGSGGHYIAEKLAERLGIELLDKNLVERVAEEKGYSQEAIRQFDEKGTSILFSRNINGYTSSASENIAQAQFEVLRKDAAEGMSFVVVGRCAEDVLYDQPALISIPVRMRTMLYRKPFPRTRIVMKSPSGRTLHSYMVRTVVLTFRRWELKSVKSCSPTKSAAASLILSASSFLGTK